jgi:PEP-CTERM motif-containing protein
MWSTRVHALARASAIAFAATLRKLVSFYNSVCVLTVAAALVPFAVQAATITWTGTTSTDWGISTNWTPAGPPVSTSGVVINSTIHPSVQLNSNASLTGSTGSLAVGCGYGCVATDTLTINSGVTLTMGARPVTLTGGTITGAGTLSRTTGAISGYGTISSQLTGTSFGANATVGGTPFGGFSPFVNGTPGAAITLIGQSITSGSFTVSNRGNFNFQGVTLTTPTLNGVSNNLNAGSQGGNNYYGLFSFSGAPSTIVGKVTNSNYDQFAVNGTTLQLNNFSMANNWGTSAPASFVVNAGGTLDNTVGNSNLLNTVILNGGSLSNSGGGTFASPGMITGTGLVSGPLIAAGGIRASGGTLTVDGTAGGITAASAGWGTAGGANDVLDLKGTINFSPATIGISNYPAAPTLNPNGGTIQLDGATINTTGGTGQIWVNHGQVNVASGTNTLNGSFIPSGADGTTASYSVAQGATLSLQNTTGNPYPAISGTNFNMANESFLTVGSGHDAISLTGNFSFQQTDPSAAWTYNGTAGLGPDLILNGISAMIGGDALAATNLEVGGINEGYAPAGFVDNFALDSLTIDGTGGHIAYVDLVDLYSNAGTSGSEALYLLSLFGTSTTTYGTLNLGGVYAYLSGFGLLRNGIYTDSNGNLLDIIGAPTPVPLPATLPLFASGLAGLGWLARRKKRMAAAEV